MWTIKWWDGNRLLKVSYTSHAAFEDRVTQMRALGMIFETKWSREP